ncbi:MAG: class I SAM-dependent methyltransferase [Dehalococcoidales bacterium]|nr:MAG: class I SAM-dependent methyltransferase [Dehalococcoidales bacterium]
MPEMIVATKQNIEKVFDDNAKAYDRVGPAIYQHFGSRLVDWLSPEPGTKMLDIATGKGAVLLPAARLLKSNGHVTGIDLSAGLLQEADHSVHQEGLTNITLRKMDAEHLEFPDETFDCVTCAFSLFFFPHMEDALNEMYRVCKLGGRVAVTVFDQALPPFDPIFPVMLQQLGTYQGEVRIPPHGMSFTPEEIETLLRQHGFHSIMTHGEKEDFIYTNEKDVWAFLPLRLMLFGTDETTHAPFKHEFLTKLRPLFGPDGLHVSVAAIYAMGQR